MRKKKLVVIFSILMMVLSVLILAKRLFAGICEDWLWECEQTCQINPNCDSSYCVGKYLENIIECKKITLNPEY